ncbi:response regulator [Sulfurimonas sp.]|uniref:response regulator n=1 Tax=Sulfurimonas sp. TaxID=2022749 RepID=UPI0026210D1A|nr:response regulator [Sulfurimonas sp.]
MYLKFLAQYQLEIITVLALLLLFILYVLLKKRPKKRETLLEIKPAVVDEYEQDTQNAKETEKDIYDTHTSKVEEEEEKEKEKEIVVDNFKRQTVPPHGKIKKEDFSKFSRMRILLAEDNIINQKVILGLLGDSGIEIVLANDGQEALNILENDDNFTLILMDAHMPNIDGFEATRIIRKNPKYNHIVVVALSGDTASDDIKKMKDAGMSETLEKPLKMDALYDILYAYNMNIAKQKSTIVTNDNNKLLNTEIGLNICGGDINFYKDILKEFLQDYGNSDEALLLLIKKNKLEEADQLLLDIVGICANLGAEQLHNIVLETKTILKTPSKNLSSILQSYKNSLKQTTERINKYIQEN